MLGLGLPPAMQAQPPIQSLHVGEGDHEPLQSPQRYVAHPFERGARTGRRLVDGPWQPLRIVPYMVEASLAATLDTEQRQFLEHELVPAAASQWARALSTVRVAGNLRATQSCFERFTTPSGDVCSSLKSQQRCGTSGPVMPADHFAPRRVCTSCFQDGRCTGCSVQGSGAGVPGADIVLYITADNEAVCSGRTLAQALWCQRDQYDRPTFGHVNFCPSRVLRARDPATWGGVLATAVHEFAHTLGLSEGSFALMRDADRGGEPRTPRGADGLPPLATVTCADGRTVQRRTPAASTLRVTSTQLAPAVRLVAHTIVTPRVAAAARAHFACAALAGAELENQPTGGSACWGSHWEERLFLSAIMSAVESGVGAGDRVHHLSNVTLAFFEDTGWYKADYSLAMPPAWGYRAGCAFAQQRCLGLQDGADGRGRGELAAGPAGAAARRHFCAASAPAQAPMCMVGRTHRGYCAGGTEYGSSIPARFQYFASAARGGVLKEADYCPVPTAFLNGDCRDPANSPASAGRANFYGETHGTRARCFVSTLRQPAAKPGSTGAGDDLLSVGERAAGSTSCHEARCEAGGGVSVRVAPDGKAPLWVACPAAGGAAATQGVPVPGFQGRLFCPEDAAAELCAAEYAGCPRGCDGWGACVGAGAGPPGGRSCDCMPGFGGNGSNGGCLPHGENYTEFTALVFSGLEARGGGNGDSNAQGAHTRALEWLQDQPVWALAAAAGVLVLGLFVVCRRGRESTAVQRGDHAPPTNPLSQANPMHDGHQSPAAI
eukprot:g97.t1